jgi:hypothetical protein
LKSKLEQVLDIIQHEPNYETFEYKGFKVLIKRNMHTGCLLGYVGLPGGHKFYGKNYNDDIPIDCHGGLTFTNLWEDEKDNLWYIGFDCAHAYDYMPFLQMQLSSSMLMERDPAVSYKDINFVRNECKSIVDQLLTIN